MWRTFYGLRFVAAFGGFNSYQPGATDLLPGDTYRAISWSSPVGIRSYPYRPRHVGVHPPFRVRTLRFPFHVLHHGRPHPTWRECIAEFIAVIEVEA